MRLVFHRLLHLVKPIVGGSLFGFTAIAALEVGNWLYEHLGACH